MSKSLLVCDALSRSAELVMGAGKEFPAKS
jgi:hypothetical protein